MFPDVPKEPARYLRVCCGDNRLKLLTAQTAISEQLTTYAVTTSDNPCGTYRSSTASPIRMTDSGSGCAADEDEDAVCGMGDITSAPLTQLSNM